MPISATAVCQTASSQQGRSLRPRFTIRADAGFLAACGGIGGPPVTTVTNATDAVHFVDLHAARTRALLMHEVGWTNLRIVEVLVPSAS